MTVYVTADLNEKKVTFQSKNTTDLTKWTGVIYGVITYQMAQQMMDVVSYNAAVQKADPTVGDVSTLHFFVLHVSSQDSQTATYVFANEWISSGTFSVIQDANILHIDVYDPTTNDPATILALLKSNGYTAVCTGVTSNS